MGELLNVVVAVAVVAIVFRWATGGNGTNNQNNGQPNAATVLGFRPKNVTDEMLNTVQSMFPDIPKDNIRYDLLRTGSTEITTNKILEKGFLEAPPASYYRLYPRVPQPEAPARPAAGSNASTSGSKAKSQQSLINRFHLEKRVESPEPEDLEAIAAPNAGSTKATWEATPEKREQSLKERKERMILAARKRLLEQEKGKGKAA